MNGVFVDPYLKERRERIATIILAGLVTRQQSYYDDAVADAVNYTDALIAVLDKPKEEPLVTDLNQMWAELERYQPYADKHGFGEAWLRMTTERTEDAADAAAARDVEWCLPSAVAWAPARGSAGAAADAASRAAYLAADAAADAAAHAAKWAQRAIDRIRKAIEKEQEPEEPKVLGVLDVVRTPKGALAVIEAAAAGNYSVVLPNGSGEKVAWYTRDELKFVGELKDLVERAGET